MRFHLKMMLFMSVLMLPVSAWAADDLVDLLLKKGTITKEEADSLQKRQISTAIGKITFYGDFRLRQDSMWYAGDGNSSLNVNRQRLRLRLGSDISQGPFILHFRLASGTGDQQGTNQSLQRLSAQKPIWIDRAYLEYGGIPNLRVMGGRMENPFYLSLTSYMVWDDDYNPEGLAEQYVMKWGDRADLFANFAQIVLDGGGSGSTAQWMMAFQAGTKIKSSGVSLAVTYYTLANGTNGTFSQPVQQHGNTRVGATSELVNPYNVVLLTAAFTTESRLPLSQSPLPITVSFDYVRNTADTVQAFGIEDENEGYSFGFQIGKATDAKKSEFMYLYRHVETDATLADIADSDFGPSGGTNRKGHILSYAYNWTKTVQLKAKYINSKILNDDLPPAPIAGDEPNPTHHRLQADIQIKF